ncbi:hypothetical protein HPB47_028297 [Ixodes persulcatus]|uniref:Uncharacterized protein n=1 Tax=Ixodes persulcatus TaxID=34615 RepID=A0AC60PV35_IXOPE|nr:hypothetical protein HPB47_028297 [Ixodes persulcatus]
MPIINTIDLVVHKAAGADGKPLRLTTQSPVGALPLATAVVSFLVTMVTSQAGPDDVFLEVDFGDGRRLNTVIALQDRQEPGCWTRALSHRYEKEGLFRSRARARLKSDLNITWTAALKDAVGVYKDLRRDSEVYLRTLELPPEIVGTGTEVTSRFGGLAAFAVTVAYRVSGLRDRGPMVLLYNSTGGANHEMRYVIRAAGRYNVQATISNPVSAVTSGRNVTAYDPITELKIKVRGRKRPFIVPTSGNLTFAAVYATGSIHSSVLPWPIVAEDEVKGLQLWLPLSVGVGVPFLVKAALVQGTSATLDCHAEDGTHTIMQSSLESPGVYSGTMTFQTAGRHRLRVQAANAVSSEGATRLVQAWTPLPKDLRLGRIVGCGRRGHTAAVFTSGEWSSS